MIDAYATAEVPPNPRVPDATKEQDVVLLSHGGQSEVGSPVMGWSPDSYGVWDDKARTDWSDMVAPPTTIEMNSPVPAHAFVPSPSDLPVDHEGPAPMPSPAVRVSSPFAAEM